MAFLLSAPTTFRARSTHSSDRKCRAIFCPLTLYACIPGCRRTSILPSLPTQKGTERVKKYRGAEKKFSAGNGVTSEEERGPIVGMRILFAQAAHGLPEGLRLTF